ncbi:MAG: CsgE family curli-type amyloid fiber assembly protein [Bacteroidota bacterium]
MKTKVLCCMALIFGSISLVMAQQPPPLELDLGEHMERPVGPDGIEMTEFIFNETITKLGNDFYHHFFQEWFNPSEVRDLSIHVRERPIPGMGSLVNLVIDGQVVYQGVLRPGFQKVVDAAEAAVQQAQEFMTSYEMMQQQLGKGDLSGSGIF